jgi:hypothetical protein
MGTFKGYFTEQSNSDIGSVVESNIDGMNNNLNNSALGIDNLGEAA